MKAEFQEIKKSHYYSQGDSIITRELETKVSGLMTFIEYHPMVSHEVGDVVSFVFTYGYYVNRCCVIEEGVYVEVVPAGAIGAYTVFAIGIELPQDRAEEVCGIIQAIKEL